MGIRETRRTERRNQLLDTAMSVIVEEGIDALTIARVAERMGASVGGLYRYFDSKGAILMALQERAIGDLWAFIERHLDGLHTADPLRLLHGAFWCYLEHARAHPAPHELILKFLSAPRPVLTDEDARDINRHILGILEPCAEWIRALTEAGSLTPGDPLQRVHALWAFVHGMDHFRRRDRILPESLQTEVLFEVGFSALLSGWGLPAELGA